MMACHRAEAAEAYTHLIDSLQCMAVPQARPAPSPRGGEGWGEGVPIERLVPPHPHPLPVGERESRCARLETVDPYLLPIRCVRAAALARGRRLSVDSPLPHMQLGVRQ